MTSHSAARLRARFHGLNHLGDRLPYDIVALVPVIQGAGGIVTGWDGGPAAVGGSIVAAGDPRLHEQALRLLNG